MVSLKVVFVTYFFMELSLILGPMKSGKSFDLISYFAPLRFTKKKFALFQSDRNVRDGQIESRNGAFLAAQKISSFADVVGAGYEIIGIDEIHMFAPEEAENIKKILLGGTRVIAAGLDLDYKGKMFEVVKKLFELAPGQVKYRRAVCEKCLEHDAIYSQVYNKGVPITDGMPPVIPDDGTYTYAPLCRSCFVAE